MNSHQPILPVQPAIPLHHGRRPHEILYHPQLQMQSQPYPQNYQQPYQHGPPQHYQPNPYQQQWYPYQHMSMPMPRPYPPYPPMMASPYPMSHHTPPINHRHHAPPPTPSSPSVHPHASSVPPSSTSPPIRVPPTSTVAGPGPSLAPPTPPPPPTLPAQREPYYPPLPWYSCDETSFPFRSSRRRRRKPAPQSPDTPVQLPIRPEPIHFGEPDREESQISAPETSSSLAVESSADNVNLETPATSLAPSEADSTQPTTPSSATAPAPSRTHPAASSKPSHRPNPSAVIIPAIPNIPLPTRPTKPNSLQPDLDMQTGEQAPMKESTIRDVPLAQTDSPASAPKRTMPKSWADLVRAKPSASNESAAQVPPSIPGNSIAVSTSGSLSEAFASYKVAKPGEYAKASFLEPRGLVNTGNMCYMNSILQVLVFCVPFYEFLDRIGNMAVHTFQSDIPMMDAMILFLREFKVIDSAESAQKLRMRLKDGELEQYGESFIPEFVYDIIRKLPKFASMRRGHQQDAEEFLGFLLEELHVECSKVMQVHSSEDGSNASTPTNESTHNAFESVPPTSSNENEWLEVGRKQKAAVTRSSGAISTESPITKIFGGKLRSVLRVPGMKDSVTLEPYQPLQLDVSAPNVTNIIEALKGLTRSETLHGEFNSPRGPGKSATKQVFIETLPQVLILHLKRFQYDNQGGTQKVWKKVGYPLELEIPKEVFPQHRRPALMNHGGLPKYRLISVVYHHGKNATGGHYTVDVRRQDDREWIRLDDTVLRRIRSEDVAHSGSEEDPKILALALEQHKNDSKSSRNVFEQLDEDEQAQTENGWSEVNGASTGISGHAAATTKKWSGVVNGSRSPTTANGSGKATPVPATAARSGIKDNKVAYLLFYQKISG